MPGFKVNKITGQPELPDDCNIFCDLDGTIYDDRSRLKYLPQLPWDDLTHSDFKDYHDQMAKDPIVENMVDLLKTPLSEKSDVVFFTSRPVRYRQITEKRLRNDFEISHNPSLFMRPNEDTRKSSELKYSLFLRKFRREDTFTSKPFIFFENELDVLWKINQKNKENKITITSSFYLVTVKGAIPKANFYLIDFA